MTSLTIFTWGITGGILQLTNSRRRWTRLSESAISSGHTLSPCAWHRAAGPRGLGRTRSPDPEICTFAGAELEIEGIATWIKRAISDGIAPSEVGLFVRST